MSGANGVIDPYEAVLDDLRAKRERIDQAIATIEAIRGEMIGAPMTRPGDTASPLTPLPDEAPSGMFLGMTIVDATKKLLAVRRQTLGNPAIASALNAGGLILNSKEPANTINSVLTRRFNEHGDIVRVKRGIWGLKEWYPHTTFRKKDDGLEVGGADEKSTEPYRPEEEV